MIQKVDNLKKGDLVYVIGVYQNYHAIYLKHKIKDNVVISIDFQYLDGRCDSMRTRNSTRQRIYKITEDNLSSEELNQYKAKLIELGLNTIPNYLTLKNGDKIPTSTLKRYIEDNCKLSVVKEMNNSNNLGLKTNKDIADDLFHNPDELIKEIFSNAINQ